MDYKTKKRIAARVGRVIAAVMIAYCAAFILDFLNLIAIHSREFYLAPLILIGLLLPLVLCMSTRWAFRIVSLSVSSCFAIICLEVICRVVLFEPYVPVDRITFEERVSTKWPRQVAVKKTPGQTRLVGLCDSFGVNNFERNHLYLITPVIETHGGQAEMVNLSVSAYEPVDQHRLLRRHGMRYKPDIVVHGFFVGNDFRSYGGDYMTYNGVHLRTKARNKKWLPRYFLSSQYIRISRRIRENAAQLNEQSGRRRNNREPQNGDPNPEANRNVGDTSQGEPLLRGFEDDSLSWVNVGPTSQLDEDSEIDIDELVPEARNASGFRVERPSLSRANFIRTEGNRLEFCKSGEGKVPLDRHWSRTEDLLIKIREVAEMKGGKYVLVIHPDRYQVEEKLQLELARRFKLDLADYDFELPQRRLKQYCEEHGIPHLDLLPILREHGAQGGMYKINNTHYSYEGDRVVAKAIAEFLLERDLIPDAQLLPDNERWTPEMKMRVVLQILRGQVHRTDLSLMYGIPEEELQGWITEFVNGGFNQLQREDGQVDEHEVQQID